MLALCDPLREEACEAVAELWALGIAAVELLTGDRAGPASCAAAALGIEFRAGLLPEEKAAVVREYQARGETVVMVGDGINDAPALAQANVGIALGPGGTALAAEAAGVVLLGADWRLVPESIRRARRAPGVVRANLGFTAVYNAIAIPLAVLGVLSPVLAAAAHAVPDLCILANSARLVRR